VIAAPPEKVYAAFVDPEALLAWLPPSGMTGKFERFDLRPGGSYRMVLTYGDPLLRGARPRPTPISSTLASSRSSPAYASCRQSTSSLTILLRVCRKLSRAFA
jgi:hypothetical protein